jgi:glycine dehydrogenase subunit 2
MGFDIVHFNTHKTFSTPHGGGGPGSGPIAVRDYLTPFLPAPRVYKTERGTFGFDEGDERSIGRVKSFHGNFGVLVRAWAYIRTHGPDGLRRASEIAVLNANYILAQIADLFETPYGTRCMHEFVLSASNLKRDHGVRALDVAKRLIDFGVHPPTIYFPLLVEEALMVEPTETESRETLDNFVATVRTIVAEAAATPELLLSAPYTAPVRRLDEALAARQPVLRDELVPMPSPAVAEPTPA